MCVCRMLLDPFSKMDLKQIHVRYFTVGTGNSAAAGCWCTQYRFGLPSVLRSCACLWTLSGNTVI
jgi:hypothetical protein